MDTNTIEVSEADGSALTAVLVHPHPDMGGDRFNHVVEALYRALPAAGVSAARFDLSSSDPEQARQDVLVAMGVLDAATVALVGYSFGADMALGIDDQRVAGWAAIAPPLRFGDFLPVAADDRPKVLIVPERDQFTPPARVRERSAGWVSTEVVVIDGADHFLHASSASVVAAVRDWLHGQPWAGVGA